MAYDSERFRTEARELMLEFGAVVDSDKCKLSAATKKSLKEVFLKMHGLINEQVGFINCLQTTNKPQQIHSFADIVRQQQDSNNGQPASARLHTRNTAPTMEPTARKYSPTCGGRYARMPSILPLMKSFICDMSVGGGAGCDVIASAINGNCFTWSTGGMSR